MTEENLRAKIDKLIEIMDEKEKKKASKFKLPFKAKVGKASAKKNYVTVMQIKNNRDADFFKVKVDEGVFESKEGIPYVGTSNYMLNYRGKPLLINPEWSLTPFSPEEHLDESVKLQRSAYGNRLIANYLEKQAIKPKGSIGGIVWVVIIAAVLIGGYYLLKK